MAIEQVVQAVTAHVDEAVAKAKAPLEATLAAEQKKHADHLKLPAPAGHAVAVEPPKIPTLLLGGSYGSGASKEFYQRRCQTARIYFTRDLPTDIKAGSMFRLAYEEGVRHFTLSYRGTQGEVAVGKSLSTIPSDCTFLATYWHEPEDNIADGSLTLADWRARNIRDAKIMRDVGVTPISNLMQYTLVASNRKVSDYYLDGAHEGMTFDYYMNPAKGKDDPAAAVDRMVAAAKAGGAKFTGLGEAGLPDSVADTTRVDLIKKLRTKMLNTPEVRFAQFWSSGEFKFTEATANAWFEGR